MLIDPTIKNFEEKYGKIIDGVWPDEAKHCVLLNIPSVIGGSWINTLTRSFVEHIYCNRDFAVPLMKALENVKDAKLLDDLKTFDGCFEVRDVRGIPGFVSCHSYGMAIDINASRNQMGHVTTFSTDFVRCFIRAGFLWGGTFKRIDPMHFTLGW